MAIRRHMMGTMGTHLLNVVLGLGTSIFTSRVLGPEGKGDYAIFMSSINLFVLVLGLGVFNAIKYYLAKKEVSNTATFNTFFFYVIFITSIFSLIVWINDQWIHSEFFLPARLDESIYRWILIGCFFLILIQNLGTMILMGNLQFKWVNTLNLSKVILTAVSFGSLYFFIYGPDREAKSEIAFYVHLLVSLLMFGLALFFLRRKLNIGFALSYLSKRQLKLLFSWGGISYVATLAQFLNYRIDFWFVQYFEGSQVLGVYALAANLGQLFWLIPVAIASVLHIHVASSDEGKHLKTTLLLGRLIWIIGLLGLIFLALFGKGIIHLLYGEKFEEAYLYLIFLMLGIIPFGVTKVYAGYFLGCNMHRKNMRASLLGLFFTILLNLVLMPYYGVYGAIWATIISYFMTTIYVISVMRANFQVSYHEVFFLGKADVKMVLDRISKKFT